MLAAVRSATLIGVDGQPVTVEVHVSSGLPAYQVVGLPDAAVRESRERVRAALLSSGMEWPQRRITVNPRWTHSRSARNLMWIAVSSRAGVASPRRSGTSPTPRLIRVRGP